MARAKSTRKPSAAAKAKAAPARRRRAPEVARQEILDAAERLLRAHNPDSIGLKEVAVAAEVSHALVTHYFGTYTGLVEAVLLQRQAAVREAMLAHIETAALPIDGRAMLEALFTLVEDPLHLKLWLWLRATERPAGQELFPFRDQGLRRFVDVMVARRSAAQPDIDAEALRKRLELSLMVVISAAHGYAIGKGALAATLGYSASPELDAAFRQTLGDMVFASLPPPR